MTIRLVELTREQARSRAEAGAVCLLPVGALEQHGDHLPLGTDALLVETVALRTAQSAKRDVIVAPTVWTGLSPHHVRLGPTVTLEPELLISFVRAVVGELRRSFAHVVIVNGHGGNRGWLGALALVEDCPAISYWELVDPELMRTLFATDLGSVGHAGQVETSAMLEAHPQLVGTPGGAFEPIARANDPLLLPDMGQTGVLGDPRAASAALGEQFLHAAVERLGAYLDALGSKGA